MSALLKKKKFIILNKDKEQEAKKVEEAEVPVDTVVCPSCKAELVKSEVVENKYVCYECGSYFRVRTKNRIKMVADAKTFTPWFEDMEFENPLNFPNYEEKITATQEKTGLHEGVTIGEAKIYGEPVVLGVCDARFLMGSMGHIVGEKIAAAVEQATEKRLPVVLFCCSGGARMQEGIISLMQMAKTSAAIKKHSKAGLLYVPVLTDPTTGGVTASFAMLGDIILAEPGALIGFAGPRVIEQTIGQKLPEGFQRAEFQLEHGFVDAIVERKDLKKTLYKILKMHHVNEGYANFTPATEFKFAPSELMKERSVKSKSMSAWEKVKAARSISRPASVDYMNEIFEDFMEFHGDRYFRDDPAIVGGVAYLDGQPVTVIGVYKGKDMKDCAAHNYGMPSPEGYRKALRLMKQAEKFNRPIITFVNTSGAFCGMEAEEGGQGEAIARNLYEMSDLKVPVLCLMIGEGGSGGALALAVGNEVWMMENATYSILSPEGFASILWKDGKRAKEAAEVMKITAEDLHQLRIVEKIIPEFGGADEDALHDIAMFMKCNMREFLEKYSGMNREELAEDRYKRFRSF
ncbi:MAG: acetyl-CoA carboxylase carboxyltransferase subunit beta [Lachnospiraceae bacterium]|nr:acetyl-CoA carboxylase carboxyltransferase subunit beta [Lachnospiraceae bacterium]